MSSAPRPSGVQVAQNSRGNPTRNPYDPDAKPASPFARLTWLLQLFTLLNVEEVGNTTFKPTNYDETRAGIDKIVLNDLSCLDAVAAILVSHHEIVACSYFAEKVHVEGQKTDPDRPTSCEEPVGINAASQASSTYPLKLAVIANPDFSTDIALLDPHNPHKVKLLPEGVNLWERVRKSDWYGAFTYSSPLSDHAATICAYLNHYRTIPSDQQPKYSRVFSCYLLTACWPKIHRRVTSWQAIGFIYRLNTVNLSEILAARWKEVPQKNGPGDQSLITFLREFDDETLTLLLDPSLSSGTPNQGEPKQKPLPTLCAVFRSDNTSTPLISQTTVKDYHELVLSALKGFVVAIERLSKHYRKLSEAERTPRESGDAPMTDRQAAVLDSFKSLYMHNRLLVFIFSSTSFKTYIDLLTSAQDTTLWPSGKAMQTYKNFRRQLCRDSRLPEDNTGDEFLEDDDYPGDVDASARRGALLRWLKTFIVHFASKKVLERHVLRAGGDIEMAVIAVQRSNLYVEASWQDIETIIGDAIPPHSSMTVSTASKTLKEKVINAFEFMPSAGYTSSFTAAYRNAITTFHDIISVGDQRPSTRYYFSGGFHTETVFGTLARYFNVIPREGRNEELIALCKKMLLSDMIAVSKLCCPVCWRLFRILSRLAGREIVLRGGHPVVYPLELPQWLPDDIVEELTNFFQDHLYRELDLMMQSDSNPGEGGNRHVSHESESAASVTSSVAGAEDHDKDIAVFETLRRGN